MTGGRFAVTRELSSRSTMRLPGCGVTGFALSGSLNVRSYPNGLSVAEIREFVWIR